MAKISVGKIMLAAAILFGACAGEGDDPGAGTLTSAGGTGGSENQRGATGGAPAPIPACMDYPDCPSSSAMGTWLVMDDATRYGLSTFPSPSCPGRTCAPCRWAARSDSAGSDNFAIRPGDGPDRGFEQDYPRCRVPGTEVYCTGYHTFTAEKTDAGGTKYRLRQPQPGDDCN